MPDLVRIRDPKTSAEYSVGRRRAQQLVERGAEIVTGRPATDGLGRALPPTPPADHTDTEPAPATEAKTGKAATSKEQNR